MAFFVCVMSGIFEFYIDPIIGVQYTNLGVPIDNVGFAFALIGGTFGLGSYITGRLC